MLILFLRQQIPVITRNTQVRRMSCAVQAGHSLLVAADKTATASLRVCSYACACCRAAVACQLSEDLLAHLLLRALLCSAEWSWLAQTPGSCHWHYLGMV